MFECKDSIDRIIVVNNVITDNTANFWKDLALEHSMLDVVNETNNLGGASGFNHGIKRAMQLDAENVWVMDNDCIVDEQTIRPLLNAQTRLEANGVDWGFLRTTFGG